MGQGLPIPGRFVKGHNRSTNQRRKRVSEKILRQFCEEHASNLLDVLANYAYDVDLDPKTRILAADKALSHCMPIFKLDSIEDIKGEHEQLRQAATEEDVKALIVHLKSNGLAEQDVPLVVNMLSTSFKFFNERQKDKVEDETLVDD